jgi:type 1 glutamine amidotransferase
VRVCEDAGVLDSAATLGRYDLVFLHLYNAKTPTLSAGAKENLASFVKDGKGLAISHLSSAAFKEWEEFHKMCGRYWVMGKSGHGPRAPFKARIANKDQKTEPLAFTVDYGKGRVFQETFGHDGKALQNLTVQKLIQRGCEWAATGKVQ